MPKKLFDRRFAVHLLLFFIFNLLLYLFIVFFNSALPFQKNNYISNAHHFLPDPRIQNQPFNLLSGLAQFDSQWYMKIAMDGYSYIPQLPLRIEDKTRMQNLIYAFFPLYPLLVFFLNSVLVNIQLSAFLISNFILLLGFASLYLVLADLYSHQVAIKTSWLFYTFPFTIFFRSYYPEGLLVLLLIWLAYFILKQRWVSAGIILAFINITKGSVILINLLYLVLVIRQFLTHRFPLSRLLLLFILPIILFLIWSFFNFFTTGNPLYFSLVQSAWHTGTYPFPPWLYNLIQILNIKSLHFHYLHSSQVECTSVIILSFLLFVSYRRLNSLLWWISLIIFLTPLLVRDLSSYSRYQSVSFPIYIFLSQRLKSVFYYPLLVIFIVGLFLTSLFFVNWYWVG
jgi:hypothetical protein